MNKRIRHLLALLVLILFGGYHTACFLQYRDFSRSWRPSLLVGTNVFWLARWKMFTGLSTWHSVPEFQARFIDMETGELSDWEHVPMEEMYPARWESGYRWERPAVYKIPHVRNKFMELACERDDAVLVRMVMHKTKATPGRLVQPRRRYKQDIVGGFRCGTELPGPKGVRL